MSKHLTRGQYWEIIIVVLILLIIAYRVALVYGYVPEKYHPSVLADDIYTDVKKGLKVESEANNVFSDLAAWSLERLNATEEYLKERKLRYERAEEVSKRCNENMIFRFFMHMGEENTECTESNLRTTRAIEQINNDSRKPGSGDEPTAAPAPYKPATTTVPSAAQPATIPTPTPTPTPAAPPVEYIPQPSYEPAPAAPQRPRDAVTTINPDN